MLHTKWKSARRFWRRRYFKVFTIYGRGGHLGHMTWTIYTNYRSPFPRRLHIKFGFDWPSRFGGEDVLKCERMDDDDGRRRRTTDPWVSYKLSGEPSAQVS